MMLQKIYFSAKNNFAIKLIVLRTKILMSYFLTFLLRTRSIFTKKTKTMTSTRRPPSPSTTFTTPHVARRSPPPRPSQVPSGQVPVRHDQTKTTVMTTLCALTWIPPTASSVSLLWRHKAKGWHHRFEEHCGFADSYIKIMVYIFDCERLPSINILEAVYKLYVVF